MRTPALEPYGLFDETLPGAVPRATSRSAARTRRRAITIAVLVAADLLAIVLSELAATAVSGFPPAHALRSAIFSLPSVAWPLVLFGGLGALMLASLAIEHLYDPDELDWGSGQLKRTVQAVSMGVVAFILISFAFGLGTPSREWTLASWAFAAILVAAGRLVTRDILGRFNRGGFMIRPTLIVGSNQEAADVTRSLARSDTGLRPVGYVSSALKDQLSLDFVEPMVPRSGSPREIVEVIARDSIDTVVIVASAFDYEVLDRIIADLRGTRVSIRMATGLSNVLSSRVAAGQASGIPLITVKPVSLTRTQLLTKRAFDLTAASLGVLAMAPLWLPLVAIIKLTSKGPVFYKQERVGMGGAPFQMLKFRSMVADADSQLRALRDANEADGPLFKIKDDPRVTPVGRFMRRFSLDELPQLINVVQGDMGLVGPRPALPEEVAHYRPRAARRLEVVPGITGLWQVSGRSDIGFDDMIDLDLFYIENWSVTLDLSMLARTIPAVLSARGAY
jgi:exopolysaccharide biosynthesis polyprenyl glycosylphosphotransferase